ncbi:MAG: DEAD/DEAH box helicase [Desulfatirhabdiaceae bacterium]
MAIDRKLKQKRKREEARKKTVQERERIIQRDKLDEYHYLISQEMGRSNWQAILPLALKGLKISPSNDIFFEYACRAASQMRDDKTLLKILIQGWRFNQIHITQHALVFAQLLFEYQKQDAELILDVLTAILKDRDRFRTRLKAPEKKQAEYLLLAAQRIISERTAAEISAAAKPKPARSISTGTEAERNPAAPSDTKPVEKPPEAEPLPDPEVRFDIDMADFLSVIDSGTQNDIQALNLTLAAYRLGFRSSYDQLICLGALTGVESFWHQQETARKVLRSFRGRAILADEVGLGKTIEASLILKEYMMRGLVKSALILAPSSLINQWKEELKSKFDLDFAASTDPVFRENPDQFWQAPYLLVSLQTARSKRRMDEVCARPYDMLIVDEAHHLKNQTTQNWKLVNAIQKTFLLLLTATPVQNNLEELYNLVTLLKPGHLKTRKVFKEQFVARGNPTDPQNRERLRDLLKEVMVRNTRSASQIRLPPRFATTTKIASLPEETMFYQELSQFTSTVAAMSAPPLNRMVLRKLLEAAGSSHAAALAMLERIDLSRLDTDIRSRIKNLVKLGKSIRESAKAAQVLHFLQASSDQKIVFVNHLATLSHIHDLIQRRGIACTVYQGSMTADQKSASIQSFREGRRVLLATGSGGEGHNLQFCHVLINYDLPWNPMEIEQRIGRLHRIGQENPVSVYNFCQSGTVEDEILEILDKKINMFELVVGEIDMILGRLQGDQEFSDMVYDLWVTHPEEAERKKAFNALAARIKRARTAYESSKELDEKLFQEDFGV